MIHHSITSIGHSILSIWHLWKLWSAQILKKTSFIFIIAFFYYFFFVLCCKFSFKKFFWEKLTSSLKSTQNFPHKLSVNGCSQQIRFWWSLYEHVAYIQRMIWVYLSVFCKLIAQTNLTCVQFQISLNSIQNSQWNAIIWNMQLTYVTELILCYLVHTLHLNVYQILVIYFTFNKNDVISRLNIGIKYLQ